MNDAAVNSFLFNLFVEKDSLDDKELQIRELLAMCNNEEEFFIVRHALKNLIILSQNKLAAVSRKLAEHIINLCSTTNNVAVVAMAWNEEPDSSQALLQMIKPAFIGIKNVKLFNSVPSFIQKNRIANFSDYILIDDFSGTGSTVKNRLEYINNHSKSIKHNIVHHVGILFGMPAAKQLILETGASVNFLYTCIPGISGHFDGEDRDKYIKAMQNIESSLSQDIDGTPLPSLGYGKAEALFCIKNYNAPNSNFPILWWPKLSDMTDRDTILTRFEN